MAVSDEPAALILARCVDCGWGFRYVERADAHAAAAAHRDATRHAVAVERRP